MGSIKAFLEGLYKPGLYRLQAAISADDLRLALKQAGYNFFFLDGKQIASKADFFDETSSVLFFPDYFGRNWDAFDDLINDLSWVPPANANVILYDNIDLFAKANPEDFKMAYYGLAYAARRGTASLPCYVLLRGNRELLPEDVKVLGDD